MIDFVICVDSHNIDKIKVLVQSIRDHHSSVRVNLITEADAECDFIDRMYVVPYSYLFQKKDPYMRINRCTYLRFWIHYAWPDIKRCIYVDWDTLVIGNMLDELDGDYLIKMVKSGSCFNAGVIYFNFTNPHTIELLENCRTSDLEMDDQSILNNVFRGQITEIDKKYNFIPYRWLQIKDMNDVRCIHYVGVLKPWDIKPIHLIYYNKVLELYGDTNSTCNE